MWRVGVLLCSTTTPAPEEKMLGLGEANWEVEMSENSPTVTTPTATPPHGVAPRGLDTTPGSSFAEGRFGRMFRTLPSANPSPDSLVALGSAMIQGALDEDGKRDKPLGTDDDDENTAELNDELRLPAGYTYFGQFVDHDITFDPVSSLSRQNDPDALTDFRTPAFDLDNLYGRGPSDQPYLYEIDGLRLKLGQRVAEAPAVAGPDLPRTTEPLDAAGHPQGRAIIGDPRNDENLIVSQLQSAFLRFHNEVVKLVVAEHDELSSADQFKLAQQRVRWHYQWVVIKDFLPRLVGQETIDDILRTETFTATEGVKASLPRPHLRFYAPRDKAYMPVEFAVAAYRYGHSVIRPTYLINDVVPVPVVDDAFRIPLFSHDADPLVNLNGFRPLPPQWGFQWKYFLAGVHGAAGKDDEHLPQPSYKLDATLSNPLGALPDSTASPEMLVAGQKPTIAQVLAIRNLLRGLRMGLPGGQDVARAMGIPADRILTEDQLYGTTELSPDVTDDLAGRAPLWYYILKESEVHAQSAHLGPVGGRIVAEVLIGLLYADRLSFLRVQPGWVPTLPSAVPGTFTLSDLINVAIPAPEDPSPATWQQP